VQVDKIKDLYKELSNNIIWINQRMTFYANKLKLESPRLREGDIVYLLRRNIKITRSNNKLDSKKIGPFKIKRNIRDISFKLQLPLIMRIYLIFYISLLKPTHPDTLKRLTLEIDLET
jgi:hypothetical protein